MYLTYEEYSAMGGTVDETAFSHLEFKARKLIDYQTSGRVKYGLANNMFKQDEIESIKNCVYELVKADKQSIINEDGSPVVTSVSNDGVSETYRVFNNESEFNRYKTKVIIEYLSDVYLEELPVLYIGADELPKVVDRYSNSI